MFTPNTFFRMRLGKLIPALIALAAIITPAATAWAHLNHTASQALETAQAAKATADQTATAVQVNCQALSDVARGLEAIHTEIRDLRAENRDNLHALINQLSERNYHGP